MAQLPTPANTVCPNCRLIIPEEYSYIVRYMGGIWHIYCLRREFRLRNKRAERVRQRQNKIDKEVALCRATIQGAIPNTFVVNSRPTSTS